MKISDVNLFSCMQQLDQGVEHLDARVKDIEQQLQLPLSSADYQKLFAELDRALKPLKQLRDSALALREYGGKFLERLSTLEEKSRVLFGDLYTLEIDHEVIEIKQEAEELQNSLVNVNLQTLALKVDALKAHISTLCHDNRLSEKNIVLLSSVETILSRLEKFLQTSSDLQRIYLEELFQYGELDGPSAELLMELFELSEMFELGHPLAAKRKEKLPVSIQKRLEMHKKSFDENLGFSRDQHYAPALLAAALELSQRRKLEHPVEEVGRYYGDLDRLLNS